MFTADVRVQVPPRPPKIEAHHLMCFYFLICVAERCIVMICVDTYISELIQLLKSKFDSRLCYVGLQGSYLRGEATDSSDIDIMVVIAGLR